MNRRNRRIPRGGRKDEGEAEQVEKKEEWKKRTLTNKKNTTRKRARNKREKIMFWRKKN